MLTKNLIKGQLTELKVQEEFTRYGFNVSIPNYNAARYDMIVDTEREIFKVQVKKASKASLTSFSICCYSTNSTKHHKNQYTSDEIDYFATVWKDKVYLIPIDETSKTKNIQEDNEEYLAQNVLSSYERMDDDEFYGDKIRSSNNYCIDCGCEIHKDATRCSKCSHELFKKADRPDREKLKSLIRTMSFSKIVEEYKVSDNAIRKWCDSEKLPRRKSDIKKYTDEEWNSL